MDTNRNAAPQDDGAEFLPVARTVRFNGEDITVQPLDVLQVIQVSRSLKAVLPALDRVQALLGAAQDAPGKEEAAIVVELLADYGEPLTEGIAHAIRKPVAFVRQSQDFAGLFALFSAVLGVNADFFARQVGPFLAGLRAAPAPGAGPTPSTDSAAPGTT